MHLACFMPFDKVAEMMEELLSVQTNAELLWCNLLEAKSDDTVPIAGESAAYRERQAKAS